MDNLCGCVCHKVGLFGLLCCPCTRTALNEFVNGKPPVLATPQADNLREDERHMPAITAGCFSDTERELRYAIETLLIRLSAERTEREKAEKALRHVGAMELLDQRPDLYATTLEKAEDALHKINEIRNSIIAFQSINWSAHIYPLVAALDDAGIEGMGYDEARPHYLTLLERAVAAERELAEARKDSERPLFKDGDEVFVNHPRFKGYGVVKYDTGARRRVVGVLLENGNTWEYEIDTVTAAIDAAMKEQP